MSIFLLDSNGVEKEAFCRFNGILDAIVRADTKTDWLTAAVSRNLMDEIIDEEGDTQYVPRPGVNIDVIGPIQLTPGTYDEDGNVITPPTFDNRYHVNVRVTEPALSVLDDTGYFSWINTILLWTENGQIDANTNSSEVAKKLANVALIDPDTINTHNRVWL